MKRHVGRLALLVGLGLSLFGLAACGGFGVEPAARVNGEVITQAEFQRDVKGTMDYLAVSQGINWVTDQGARAELPRLRASILDNLIEQRLLRQQARLDGVVVSEREVDDRVAQLVEDSGGRDQFVPQLQARGLDAMAFRRLIQDSLLRERMIVQRFSDPLPDIEVRRVRHILVDSVEKAAAARQRLANGESWDKVAADVSQDTATKDRGGDLGYIEKGQTYPSFEDVAFSLKVNELSQPVATPFGQHIIGLVDIRTQRPNGTQIQQLRQQALDQYLSGVRQKAQINTFVADASPAPDVAIPASKP